MDLKAPEGMRWMRLVDPAFATSQAFVTLSGGRYGRRTTGSVFLVTDADASDDRLEPAEWRRHVPRRHGRPACVHRGAFVEVRLCTGCIGSAIKTPVYVCELHGQCAERSVRVSDRDQRRDKRITACLACRDYVAEQSN